MLGWLVLILPVPVVWRVTRGVCWGWGMLLIDKASTEAGGEDYPVSLESHGMCSVKEKELGDGITGSVMEERGRGERRLEKE